MSYNTKIEWADHTFNPWIGCTKAGPGCDHCYAEADFDKRRHRVMWGSGQPRSRTKTWGDPVKWNKEAFYQCLSCGWRGSEKDSKACEHGCSYPHRHCPNCNITESLTRARARVFCASLADVFDNEVDPTWRNELFDLIAATPNLDWLLLTKRIGNVKKMLPSDTSCDHAVGFDDRFPNVWIGATICNQAEADRDIPKLLAVPAAKRFLSMEPLLGPVDLHAAYLPCKNSGGIVMDPGTGAHECCKQFDYSGLGDEMSLDWVIVGGESGANARPMHPDWVRSLRDQCQLAGVPFLFKQWGEWWEYVNEDHYTHCGAEKHAHAWVDADTGDSGKCWIVDDDGSWSNWTGTPRGLPKGDEDVNGGNMHPSVTVMGRHGKKAAGRLLDGREWNGVPA